MSYTAKWLVGALIALFVAAAVGWWFYLQKKFDDYVAMKAGVPANAVIAFDTPNSCPRGWAVFEPAVSRMIVGATTPAIGSPNKDANGVPLSARVYRAEGGEELHKLTIDEMPSHSHAVQGYTGTDADRGGRRDGLFGATNGNSGSAGGDKPHNVMSPFIALYYCMRE